MTEAAPLPATAEDGFTLPEVLVAFVIVSLGLVTAYGGIGMAYRHMSEARLRQDALAAAQSHLDGIGRVGPLVAGTATGSYPGGGAWQLTVTELAASASGQRPYLVTLDVRASGNRVLGRLRTVKLAPGARP